MVEGVFKEHKQKRAKKKGIKTSKIPGPGWREQRKVCEPQIFLFLQTK